MQKNGGERERKWLLRTNFGAAKGGRGGVCQSKKRGGGRKDVNQGWEKKFLKNLQLNFFFFDSFFLRNVRACLCVCVDMEGAHERGANY